MNTNMSRLKSFLILLMIIIIFACKKELSNSNNQNAQPPTGLKIDSTFIKSGKVYISVSWDKLPENGFKSIKLYRGISASNYTSIALIGSIEKNYIDSIELKYSTNYSYKITSISSTEVESGYSNEVSIITPQLFEKNQFKLDGISNIVVAEQTTSGNIFEYGNVLAVDSNGNSTSLKIPDAKSYILKVNYLTQCTKTLLYLNGSLSVQYNSGKIRNYINFILDTKTGNFYQLENDFGQLWSRKGSRKTPWVNGTIQYDSNGDIYIQSNSGNIIQEMTRFKFAVTSDTTIRVTTEVFALIGESYYFNYFVLPSGDILYMNKENMGSMVWKVRFQSGSTSDFTDITQSKPLIIDGKEYFSKVNTSKCFTIIDSKNQPILFINGLKDTTDKKPKPDSLTNMYGQFEMYMPFYLKTSNSKISLQPISNKYFSARIQLGGSGPITTNADLFTDYIHGMWYFPQSNNHIFTMRGCLAPGGISPWWKYDDLTNTITFTTLPYDQFEFTTYQNLLTRSYDYAFIVIKRDLYIFNLNTFTHIKKSSVDYQIYLTSYVGDGRVQFYGISFLTGKKVLGEFDKNGNSKVIREFDNQINITDIFKIGTF